jgi:hypothetical protein
MKDLFSKLPSPLGVLLAIIGATLAVLDVSGVYGLAYFGVGAYAGPIIFFFGMMMIGKAQREKNPRL